MMKANKRDTRPALIGAAINKFLNGLGAKASDADLGAKWKELIGQESELVKISRGVSGRTAYIRAKNSAARLTLSYDAPEIIKKINAYFGYEAISKIIIR